VEHNVGFFLSHEQFPPTSLVDYAVAAEEAGFDSVWASDHFHPWQDNQGHAGHAWITLAAIGARTSRLALGTAVTCPIYRVHPAIVAQAFATLAVLYPGRVFLGVGTGEAVNEAAAGGGWGPYRERAARLREAIVLIRRLWTEDWVSHDGPYFPLENARIYERPRPQPPSPIPIYVAASGPKSAALAGEVGDGLIAGPATLLGRRDVVDAFSAAVEARELDVAQVPRLVEQYVFLGTEAEALEAANLWLFGPVEDRVRSLSDPRAVQRTAEALSSPDRVIENWLISRDPSAHVDRIRELFTAGATHVAVHSPQPDQESVIDFYARDVLPVVRAG
jgi:TAT-translocated FGD2 family F420-dependent dehydrogenase